jgi:hypothetical protein
MNTNPLLIACGDWRGRTVAMPAMMAKDRKILVEVQDVHTTSHFSIYQQI